MRRVLAHPGRAMGVALLQRLGLDQPVLGSAKAGAPTTRLAALDAEASMGACLAAMAIDRGDVASPTDVPRILGRWRTSLCLSNDEREDAGAVLGAFLVFKHEFAGAPVARQKRTAVRAGASPALAILSAEDPSAAWWIRARIDDLARTPSGLGPAPLVTGDDLIRAGMAPGPRFASLLASVYDAQLEDRVATHDDALRLARQIASATP